MPLWWAVSRGLGGDQASGKLLSQFPGAHPRVLNRKGDLLPLPYEEGFGNVRARTGILVCCNRCKWPSYYHKFWQWRKRSFPSGIYEQNTVWASILKKCSPVTRDYDDYTVLLQYSRSWVDPSIVKDLKILSDHQVNFSLFVWTRAKEDKTSTSTSSTVSSSSSVAATEPPSLQL